MLKEFYDSFSHRETQRKKALKMLKEFYDSFSHREGK